MPSYKDKLSSQELADLIAYLISLKGFLKMKRPLLAADVWLPVRSRRRYLSTAFSMPTRSRRTGSPIPEA